MIFSIILVIQVYGFLFIEFKELAKAGLKGKLFFVPILIGIVIIDEIVGIRYFSNVIANKRKLGSYISWVLVLLEVTVPSIIILYFCLALTSNTSLGYYDVFNSPPAYMYFILILLSSLHQNFMLSIIAGLVATIQYLTLVLIFTDNQDYSISFVLLMSKAAFIMVTGVAAAFVAQVIKRYIEETLQTKDVLINKLDEKVQERTIDLANANDQLSITNQELATQRDEIERQKNEIQFAHKEIKDSIVYAKRIQSAILPDENLIKSSLPENFFLYKPKDVVAGDFYWLEPVGDKVLFAAADCTGHGVPGAMVSVVCHNAMNRSAREFKMTEPGKILDKTREIVLEELSKSNEEVKDGMDIALCSISGKMLHYAGANNPLWIIRKGELLETKADKQPVGKFDRPFPYTTHSIELNKGDTIYVFSDGYADQFGGDRNKKMGSKRFKEFLLSIQDKSMSDQKIALDDHFETWRGENEQLDDVCVIGVRI